MFVQVFVQVFVHVLVWFVSVGPAYSKVPGKDCVWVETAGGAGAWLSQRWCMVEPAWSEFERKVVTKRLSDGPCVSQRRKEISQVEGGLSVINATNWDAV